MPIKILIEPHNGDLNISHISCQNCRPEKWLWLDHIWGVYIYIYMGYKGTSQIHPSFSEQIFHQPLANQEISHDRDDPSEKSMGHGRTATAMPLKPGRGFYVPVFLVICSKKNLRKSLEMKNPQYLGQGCSSVGHLPTPEKWDEFRAKHGQLNGMDRTTWIRMGNYMELPMTSHEIRVLALKRYMYIYIYIYIYIYMYVCTHRECRYNQ